MIERYMIGNPDTGYWGIDIDPETKTATYTLNGHAVSDPAFVPLQYRDKLCRIAATGSNVEWVVK